MVEERLREMRMIMKNLGLHQPGVGLSEVPPDVIVA